MYGVNADQLLTEVWPPERQGLLGPQFAAINGRSDIPGSTEFRRILGEMRSSLFEISCHDSILRNTDSSARPRDAAQSYAGFRHWAGFQVLIELKWARQCLPPQYVVPSPDE